jgi:hypothetical protein
MSYPMNEAMRHAATLMAERRWREAGAAYEAICRQYPEHAAMAASQVGAAHFFQHSFALAIQWYTYAGSLGFDAQMTADNIAEAEGELRAIGPGVGATAVTPSSPSGQVSTPTGAVEGRSVPLSFVLLPRPYDATGAPIVDAHARLFPNAPRPLASLSADGKAVLHHHDNLTTFVALVAAPIPTGEADSAARFSAASFSPQYGPLQPHAAHLIVTSIGGAEEGNSRVDTLLRHTRIVAATAVAYGALAVYEGNAQATHPTAFYVDVATSMERPIILWTGVSLAQQGTRTSLLTLGARNMLGVPDILITVTRPGGNDALFFALDMLGYVMDRGAALAEGDTVGRSAEEKLHVQYVPSPIDPSQMVVKLDLP